MKSLSQAGSTRGRCRPLVFFALCAPFVSFAAQAQAQSPPSDAIALVHVAVEGAQTPPTNDLSASLRRGLANAGLKVSARPPADKAAGCNELSCLQELAASFNASLLAFAHVQTSAQKYEVRVRVVSAATGETLTTDAVSCGLEDLCPPMPQTLQRLAKEAGRKTRARLAEPPVAATVQPAPAAPPVAMTFAPPRIYDVSNAESQREATPAWVPWTLASAGGAALVTGGVLLAMNRTCESDATSCEPRSLAVAGWALSAVGLVAVGTASALWFLESQSSADTGLAVAPWAHAQGAGVSLAGRWH